MNAGIFGSNPIVYRGAQAQGILGVIFKQYGFWYAFVEYKVGDDKRRAYCPGYEHKEFERGRTGGFDTYYRSFDWVLEKIENIKAMA